MSYLRLGVLLAGITVSAIGFGLLWPQARDASLLLGAQDDPAQLSEMRIRAALRNHEISIDQLIEQALQANDADLARSFVDLADHYNTAVQPEIAQRVTDAVANNESALGFTRHFAAGFIVGEINDLASLSGTVAGDLLVYGDIRDLVREGKHVVMGEDADRLVMGLAGVGLAVTAITYTSAGGVMPLRSAVTLVKDARKAGRLGAGLTEWAGRSARGVVDGDLLQKAVLKASWTRPMESASAFKAAFKIEKAGGLMKLGEDTGRIAYKTGTRGALDILHVADGPGDVARGARLAEATGGQTRAIIKILGRGALLLTAGAFSLAWWVFAAVVALLGCLASIKGVAEQIGKSWTRRSRRRRMAEPRAAGSQADICPTPA